MITVHEFGHYLVGKLLNFQITEFAIGFGPVLYSHTSKKTGEKFTVRLIPLGGFCAFADENGLEEEQIKQAEMEEDAFAFDPAVTIISEPPVPAVEKPVPTGKKFLEQAPWKRILVLIAGATMNYLLALICIFALFFGYGQSSVLVYKVEENPAFTAECSLADMDVVLAVEGKNVFLPTDMMSATKNRQAGESVVFTVSRVVGEKREVVNVPVKLRTATNYENLSDTDRLCAALGISKVVNENGDAVADDDGNLQYMLYATSYKFGFFDTLGRSFEYSWRLAASIFEVLGELLTGKLGTDALGGPITTIGVTSQVVSAGVRPFLTISAFIGVNLAVFNLLPIPALDGSKVVFTLIEWVRGKPIDRNVEAIIHTVGILLLFGFAIFIDLIKLL